MINYTLIDHRLASIIISQIEIIQKLNYSKAHIRILQLVNMIR